MPLHKLLIAFLGCSLAMVISWTHQHYYDFEHDDAYITYRYAQNWASGNGPVFNATERVEGYTNFLWLLILTAGIKAGVDPVLLGRLLGTIFCFALLVLMWNFCCVILKRNSRYAFGIVLGLALNASIAVWARAGIETLFFTFLIWFAQWHLLKKENPPLFLGVSGILFAMVTLCRPDGGLFFLGAFCFLWFRKTTRTHLLCFTMGFLILFLPYWLWRWNYYGYFFPNTFYAKTGGNIYQQIRGLFYTYQFVNAFGGAFLFAIPLVLGVLRDSSRDTLRFYLFFLVLLWTLFVIWVGGDHMPMSRFFVPMIPALLILWFETVLEVVPRITNSVWTKNLLMGTLILLILASGVFPSFNRRRFPYAHVVMTSVLLTQWKMAGTWLKETQRPETYLASAAIGVIPYYSEMKTLDLFGLTDTHIAHVQVAKMGEGTAGHEKTDMNYVLACAPDLILRNIVESPQEERQIVYEAGKTYRLKTAFLGRGPVANFFGEVQERSLYLLYEERVP